MKTLDKVLLAAAIGAVAGTVLGILFAPEKGSDLRKKISSRAKEISEDLFEDAKEGLANLKEKMAKEPIAVN